MTEQEPQDQFLDPMTPVDPLLSSFVSMANAGTGISMTLYMHGTVVSGELVSFAQYLDGIASFLEGKTTPRTESGETFLSQLVTEFRNQAQQETTFQAEVAQAQDTQPAPAAPIFIHLRDARVVHGLGVQTYSGWWRGRLAAVDAFEFGLISRRS